MSRIPDAPLEKLDVVAVALSMITAAMGFAQNHLAKTGWTIGAHS